jgi:LysR family transcriptional activator of nhaA
MKTWLNYHHLYYFRTIATEGSVIKAARKLRLGQPTLSTQLKQFEEQLGQQLFERKGRSLLLTEAGQMVLDYANEIFALGDEMVEAINDRLHSGRVDVTIGALDSVPKHILMALASAAQKTANCRVSVLEGKFEDLLREVKGHRIDLVATNHGPTPGETSGVRWRRAARMPVVVCADKKFAGLRRGFPESLMGQPMILPTPHSKLRLDIDHWLKTRKISADVAFETQDTGLQKLLVTHQMGVAPLPEPAARELVENKEMIVLGELGDVYEELWLLTGERKFQNPVAAQIFKLFSVDTKYD